MIAITFLTCMVWRIVTRYLIINNQFNICIHKGYTVTNMGSSSEPSKNTSLKNTYSIRRITFTNKDEKEEQEARTLRT